MMHLLRHLRFVYVLIVVPDGIVLVLGKGGVAEGRIGREIDIGLLFGDGYAHREHSPVNFEGVAAVVALVYRDGALVLLHHTVGGGNNHAQLFAVPAPIAHCGDVVFIIYRLYTAREERTVAIHIDSIAAIASENKGIGVVGVLHREFDGIGEGVFNFVLGAVPHNRYFGIAAAERVGDGLAVFAREGEAVNGVVGSAVGLPFLSSS